MKKTTLAVAFLIILTLLSCQQRPPAVAGKWYPNNPDKLEEMLRKFFSNVELPVSLNGRKPLGLISPHAGYIYSGQVASCGFSLIDEGDYDTVILLGSSHHYLDDVVSIYNGKSYRTPLGTVEVDREMVKGILSDDSRFDFRPAIHQPEHSNEAQLPFLQVRLKEFKIVPIITSTRDRVLLKKLAASIIDVIEKSGKRVLVVESSDMSHYHDYRTASAMDRKTVDLIAQGKWDALDAAIRNQDCELCGYHSLLVFIDVMNHFGADDRVLLKYANSGDAMGEIDSPRVVGYSSIAFFKNKREKHTMNDEQKKYLLKLARTSIETYLKTGKKHVPVTPDDPALTAERAVFVTLNKGENLRGCIGQMIAREKLYMAVNEMALSAAFHDPRFPAVTMDELDRITIEISVLSPMQRIDDWQTIRMGIDGVWVRKGYASGVYLPQVATETGWDRETFLGSLCAHKAGIPADSYKDADTELFIFQVEKFTEQEKD